MATGRLNGFCGNFVHELSVVNTCARFVIYTGPGSYRAQLAENLAKQKQAANNSASFCQEVCLCVCVSVCVRVCVCAPPGTHEVSGGERSFQIRLEYQIDTQINTQGG